MIEKKYFCQFDHGSIDFYCQKLGRFVIGIQYVVKNGEYVIKNCNQNPPI